MSPARASEAEVLKKEKAPLTGKKHMRTTQGIHEELLGIRPAAREKSEEILGSFLKRTSRKKGRARFRAEHERDVSCCREKRGEKSTEKRATLFVYSILARKGKLLSAEGVESILSGRGEGGVFSKEARIIMPGLPCRRKSSRPLRCGHHNRGRKAWKGRSRGGGGKSPPRGRKEKWKLLRGRFRRRSRKHALH